MKLVEYRKKNKLSQKQLARIIDIEVNTYAAYEQGRNKPKLETLQKLSKLYGCTVDELLGLESQQITLNKKQDELVKLIQRLDDVSIDRVIGFALALLGEKIDFEFEKYKS